MNADMPWDEFLAGESLVLGLMGKILQRYPESGWLEDIIKQGVFHESIFASNQATLTEGLQVLTKWVQEVSPDLNEEVIDGLRSDYTRLFIGPEKLVLPPWESAYFNKERLIFQEQMLEVRSWYRRFGLAPEKIHNEPDDHIGLELSFVSHLAGLAVAALDRQDEREFQDAIQAQKDFLSEHLLRWGPRWCRELAHKSRTAFYQGIAGVTLGALLELGEVFKLEAQAAPFI